MYITNETVSLTINYLCAKSWMETVQPMVEEYQRKILVELGAKNKYNGEPVTDPNFTFMLEKDALKVYIERCSREAHKLELKHKQEECPLLLARHHKNNAEKAFVDHCFELLKRNAGILPDFSGIIYEDMLGKVYEDENGNEMKDMDGNPKMCHEVFIECMLGLILPLFTTKTHQQCREQMKLYSSIETSPYNKD